jgi:hypothetical protein
VTPRLCYDAGTMVRRLSLVFGLLIGAMWMVQILFGNLGDTSVFGNVRTFHFHTYRVIGWSFIWCALALILLSGFYTAYRTGNVRTALRVAVWSGLIGGAIALVTGMGMTALFFGALSHSPSDLAEFARSGDPSFAHYLYMDTLGGGLNLLWICPALGVVLGSLGAAAGRKFHQETFPANP